MEVINNPTTAHSSYKVVLDGSTFSIKQRYNGRTDSWYLDVYDASGNVLVFGKKLQLNMPVVSLNVSLMPLGNITVRQIAGTKTTRISRDNLGSDRTFNLVYYNLEDLS